MRTPRRARPTPQDLVRLTDSADILKSLMLTLRPTTPEYRSTALAYDAVRTCGVVWTGDPELWRSGDCARGRPPEEAFLQRPDHPKWPR